MTSDGIASNGAPWEKLFAPLDFESFVGQHWEKEHLHLRGDGTRFVPLFSLAQSELYLSMAENHPQAHLSIVRVGQPTHRVRVSEVRREELYQAIAAGSTILFENMELVWPPIALLSQVLRKRFSAKVQINAYLSPPGAQGAHLHADIQHVIALQLEGRKTWNLHGMVHQHVDNLTYARPSLSAETMRKFEEETLEVGSGHHVEMVPGDLLYVPRGQIHKATSAGDTHSLHLAINLAPVYWVEAVKAAVEVASTTVSAFGLGLPPGFEGRDPASLAQELRGVFRGLLEAVARDETLLQTLSILATTEVDRRPFLDHAHFSALWNTGAIDLDTRLEYRPGASCRLETSSAGTMLFFAGAQLKAPPAAIPAVEFIGRTRSFVVRELPGRLDPAGKLVLVRRLVRDGLLQVDPKAGSAAE